MEIKFITYNNIILKSKKRKFENVNKENKFCGRQVTIYNYLLVYLYLQITTDKLSVYFSICDHTVKWAIWNKRDEKIRRIII